MENQSQERAMARLDQAVDLLAMIAVKGLPQTEQIATLDRMGFSPKDIATVLGTTSNTVRVTLVGIRKAGGYKRKRAILPRIGVTK
jgi:DNA-directed RNA polymerase specialized sigma24 family protein